MALGSFLALFILAAAGHSARVDEATLPLASWKFDSFGVTHQGAVNTVADDAGGINDRLTGNAWTVAGVCGKSLQFDGITTHIRRPAARMLKNGGAFSVQAWIAIGAYPFNWCPIVQHQDEESAGFFFGIGDRGTVAFRLAAGGKWQGAETTQTIPTGRWAHVAGVFEPSKGVTIYIDGQPAASAPVSGEFIPASKNDLWIGRNMYELEQTAPVGKNRQYKTKISFDGILDEILVAGGARPATEIAAYHKAAKPATTPPLPARVLPAGPPGPAPFGAVYARLKYYKGWDDTWRVTDYPDVVVRFDEAPYRFVFWRGTSYIPHWVTENGIWFDNEFTESNDPGSHGSAEPMSDKQCLFSHVRIIQSSDARVVIHWRYSPVDVGLRHVWADPLTGWGDWTDEIHIIYPDGIAVRKITAHSSKLACWREWQESIVVMGPGMSPDAVIDPAGLTLANTAGESFTYSWEKQTPPKIPKRPASASIQIINTKSKYKPFSVVRSVDKPSFDIYSGEVRREISVYPWWNHWPTAFEPSNGRYAQAADRASHSSLAHISWANYATGVNWQTKIMLTGMTDATIGNVVAMARSWDTPARMTLTGIGFSGGDFDQTERAYVLEHKDGADNTPLACTLAASAESPANNVALVVKQWNEADIRLTINGETIPRGKNFRFGQRDTLDGSDLVVWMRIVATTPVKIVLTPAR